MLSQGKAKASGDGSVMVTHDRPTVWWVLNRPHRRNSLSHSMIDTLAELLTDTAMDNGLRANSLGQAVVDPHPGALRPRVR